MDSTIQLLVDALAPYEVSLGLPGPDGARLITLRNESGEAVAKRLVRAFELNDRTLLTDVVDGLRRDLLVSRNRIDPMVAAAALARSQQQVYAAC
ncbi:DUF3509 domain-containing protein [Pseudomonas mangiferae]|uniref:DUF3509 domain-containing protein n=1 Tax=Pseudomonas mangiferae TaxID=2593654 RepID=A0A553GUP0_9PSED|nr:DUF3509 domain-containing protein [Pseudomonas mangiferae]TRX73213.1 DUF3509 domain-containing protein [Pseudomonas mangiferae]